jgi:endonuclease YncB( thermonuclease family)
VLHPPRLHALTFATAALGVWLIAVTATGGAAGGVTGATRLTFRVGHVVDGDTLDLTNGARVRLVQIDSPEVYFHPECFGRQSSAVAKRLLPRGARVRLLPEPATDLTDRYGRLLRYVIRVRDGVDINIRLVAMGAAAPYFYAHRRGRYAARLEALARRARARKLGLWGHCPGTPYDPYHSVETGRGR